MSVAPSHGASPSRGLLVLALCGGLGCSPPFDPVQEHVPARDSGGTGAQIITSTAARGLEARFDRDGAHLRGGADREVITIRTERWGRQEAMRPLAAPDPVLRSQGGELSLPPRVAYERRDLTEWWSHHGDAFEQGWLLPTRPAGQGPLSLDVSITGRERVTLRKTGSSRGVTERGWRISALKAWGSDGAPLSAKMELRGDHLLISVADAHARYPVWIDPVYTDPTATLTGTSDSFFGTSVSSAGDVNGDGYGDIIVGANYADGRSGAAYVFHSSATGVSSAPATTIPGTPGSYTGWSVAGAGDVNHDGYDDVIVGAPAYGDSRGRALLYLGSATGVSTTAATTLEGEDSSNQLGKSVASAGDVNGDGFSDVIVGAYGYRSGVGRAYVFAGTATGVDSTAMTTITGDVDSSLGWSVAAAGDVNGDGYADVIIGAYSARRFSGSATVHLGSASGLSDVASATLTGEAGEDYFGFSVSGAGDVNGDGYDDVIVGAPTHDSYTGRAQVFLGSASGVSSTASATISGTPKSWLGNSVSGAGDVDGDGYDDVVVGAYQYGSDSGRAYVYFGSAAGMTTSGASVIDGSGDRTGTSVSRAGDVNLDGYDDVAIGAENYLGGVGKVSVHLGYQDADGDGYSSTEDCDDSSASISPAEVEIVADGVDQDCDSVDACYADDDGDGFGTTEVITGTALSCDEGAGADNSSDCDDTDASTYPGAEELCDALDVDEDCDGLADDDDPSAATATMTDVYVDADGDGFGGTTSVTLCDPPDAGYSTLDTDCDDSSPRYYPGADESDCTDPNDYNCDGSVAYVDADGDGFAACQDCDDADATINTDAAEIVGDGVDGDCDGLELCLVDADGDGYVADDAALVESADLTCDAPGEAPATAAAGDCDDTVALVNPDATEICNGIDDDCDGRTDIDAADSATWYEDSDGDGYVDLDKPTQGCEAPVGFSDATEQDCDDRDSAVHPGATEILDDGIDQNCDGVDAEAPDSGDGELGPDGAEEPKGTGPCACASAEGHGAALWLAVGLAASALRRRGLRAPR